QATAGGAERTDRNERARRARGRFLARGDARVPRGKPAHTGFPRWNLPLSTPEPSGPGRRQYRATLAQKASKTLKGQRKCRLAPAPPRPGPPPPAGGRARAAVQQRPPLGRRGPMPTPNAPGRPSPQLLHLVFGGELESIGSVEFRDPKALDIVGIY